MRHTLRASMTFTVGLRELAVMAYLDNLYLDRQMHQSPKVSRWKAKLYSRGISSSGREIM